MVHACRSLLGVLVMASWLTTLSQAADRPVLLLPGQLPQDDQLPPPPPLAQQKPLPPLPPYCFGQGPGPHACAPNEDCNGCLLKGDPLLDPPNYPPPGWFAAVRCWPSGWRGAV